MIDVNDKIKTAYTEIKDKFGWTNPMQSPKVEKVVISVGVGRVKKDKQRIDLIRDRLTKITGQKPADRKAKKSIAAFKLRDGEIVGLMTTLRGKNKADFLYKLVNIALPRMRDFRGIKRESVDEMGNLTLGITEHTIFPEVQDENLQDIFGLSITIVTTAKNKEIATAFFEAAGFPFQKVQ